MRKKLPKKTSVEELTEEETKVLEKVLGGKKIKVQNVNRVRKEDLKVALKEILEEMKINRVSKEDLRVTLKEILAEIRESEKEIKNAR